MTVCIIQKNKITVPLYMMKPNGVARRLGMQECLTPWGYLIPIHHTSFNIIDIIERGLIGEPVDNNTIALFYREGMIYEYAVEGKIHERRAYVAKKMDYYVRSHDIHLDAQLTTCLHLGKTVKESIEIVSKISSTSMLPKMLAEFDLEAMDSLTRECELPPTIKSR